MGWGMNASNMPTSKLDEFTELDADYIDYIVVILISY